MNIEDIKVGKWYNVPFRVVEIKSGDIHMKNGGIKAVCQPSELAEITSVERTERLWNGMCDVLFGENGTKNTETAPKYDPNRKFRKGDRVRIVEYKGRNGTSTHHTGDVVTVDKDEEDCEWVFLKADDEHKLDVIDPAYLELVTPVEELEPYSVSENIHGWVVFKDNPGTVVANYNNIHPHAKEAAEAERDRMNAEHRKEQSND